MTVTSRAAWREWLEANHGRRGSIWLVSFKKGHAGHVPYATLRDEALCFGWVDSRPAKLDEARSMLLMSPRKRGSGWSGVNKARVAALIEAGLMAAPGLAAVSAAKADGSWERLDTATALLPPDDLVAAFAAHAGSAAAFAAFPPSARRAILEWIAQAKRPETRAARVLETARCAARGERANSWRR